MAAVTLLSSIFNTSSGTKTTAGATPAAGALIVLITAHTGNTSTARPTDSQGGFYELVGSSVVKATNADTMRVWVRTSLASAVSTTFSHAPGTSTGGGIFALAVTAMTRSGQGAVRRVSGTQQFGKQDNLASGTPAPAFPAAADTNNACIGAVFSATNSTTTQTPPASWTERFDQGYATPAAGMEICSRDSGETGTTITWGGASGSAFCSVVIELDTTSPDSELLDERQNEPLSSPIPSAHRVRALGVAFLGANLLGGLLSTPPPTNAVPRSPVFQQAKVKPPVAAQQQHNLLTNTLAGVQNPFETLPLPAPLRRDTLPDTSSGFPEAVLGQLLTFPPIEAPPLAAISSLRLGEDTSQSTPVPLAATPATLPFEQNLTSLPFLRRDLSDTSQSTPEGIVSQLSTPFKGLFPAPLSLRFGLEDSSGGSPLSLLSVRDVPFSTPNFGVVQYRFHFSETSQGSSTGLLSAEAASPFSPPVFYPAPSKRDIGQILSVRAGEVAPPPVVIPPMGAQAIASAPHKRPEVRAEQFQNNPVFITPGVASSYPEFLSPQILKRVYANTSFHNVALLASAGPAVLPSGEQVTSSAPFASKWLPANTSYFPGALLTPSPSPFVNPTFAPVDPIRPVRDTSKGTLSWVLTFDAGKPFSQTDWPGPIEFRKETLPSWDAQAFPENIPPTVVVAPPEQVGGGWVKRKPRPITKKALDEIIEEALPPLDPAPAVVPSPKPAPREVIIPTYLPPIKAADVSKVSAPYLAPSDPPKPVKPPPEPLTEEEEETVALLITLGLL